MVNLALANSEKQNTKLAAPERLLMESRSIKGILKPSNDVKSSPHWKQSHQECLPRMVFIPELTFSVPTALRDPILGPDTMPNVSFGYLDPGKAKELGIEVPIWIEPPIKVPRDSTLRRLR